MEMSTRVTRHEATYNAYCHLCTNCLHLVEQGYKKVVIAVKDAKRCEEGTLRDCYERREVGTELATTRQLDYIRVLCKKAGKDLPHAINKLSKEEASRLIDKLKGTKYDEL